VARRGKSLENSLGGALSAGPVPPDGAALVRYAGGRRALTEQLSGLPRPPRRGDYRDAERYETDARRWRSASQAALRYSKGARTPRIPREAQSRIRRAATAAKRAAIAQRGLRVRMYAEVTVGSPGKRGDTRARVMPSGGPGVLIAADDAGELESLLRADPAEAAEMFAEEFFEDYGMPESHIGVVYWVKFWPEGSAEPA
jgi:hypothetical protein